MTEAIPIATFVTRLEALLESWEHRAFGEQERARQSWRSCRRESEARYDAIFQCVEELRALMKPE